MVKAFLGVGIGLGIAVGLMAAMLFTSLDSRHEAATEADILATKTAETRDIRGTGARYDAGNAEDDGLLDQDSTPTPGLRQPLPEAGQSLPDTTTPPP